MKRKATVGIIAIIILICSIVIFRSIYIQRSYYPMGGEVTILAKQADNYGYYITVEQGMVTKVYAHILDEDRKVNAQKFESAFYANPDLRGVQAPAEPAPALDVQSIILQLQQSPELLSALTSLISNQGCK